MSAAALHRDDRRHWSIAGALALAAHLGVGILVLAWARPAEPPVPEPVVLVELPPQAAPAPAVAAAQPVEQPQPQTVQPQPLTPPIDVPPVRAPLPSNPVTLPPPPPPVPARQSAPAPAAAPANPVAVSPTGTGTGASATPGNDPRAKRQEADYFALVSAHLNRRKTYPAEARQARQQGVVTVRFTVDRSGGVSGVSIKRGSGHELLDRATLDLLQRVAPLPRMPASMQRDSVTLSLPIDYSLRTS
jgi:protein TonB